MSGKKYYNYNLAAFQNSINISVKSFPDGIYNLRITMLKTDQLQKKLLSGVIRICDLNRFRILLLYFETQIKYPF